VSTFRRQFGSGPVHLLAHLLLLPLALWAILQVADTRNVGNVVLWFVAGLVLHDLVVLPLYAALDRVATRARLRGVRVINYVRFPVVVSATLFLAFVGLITQEGSSTLEFVSGIEPEGYTERYLLAVAAVFAISALALAREVVLADPPTPSRLDELDAARGW
jgi:hypothetical protein